jgi:deaminated glutathione amidase
MTAPLVAAAVQLSSQADVEENLARASFWIAEAARAGARLVALPENFAFMGEEADKCRIAEPLVPPFGPIASAVADAAKRADAFVLAGGMPERSSDESRPFNTSALFSPEGQLVARYRKVHLFDVDLPDGTKLEESRGSSAGSPADLPVAEVFGLRLGMTICYDLRFPELYRVLESKGARVVTVPAAFTLTTGKDHWHVLLRARAIENQIFVVAPAQSGKHPRGRQTYGKSLIVDPWGDVLAQAGEGEGFALARLDPAYQDKVRRALPSLSHKRL